MATAFKPSFYQTLDQSPGIADLDVSTHLYRALVIAPDGRLVRAHGFCAEDDHTALRHARQFAALHRVDLWNGSRLVGKLKAMSATS